MKKENGITLIALVITVIVLIILAAVAVSLITGEDGLFTKANHASDIYNKKSQEEADRLTALMNSEYFKQNNDGNISINPFDLTAIAGNKSIIISGNTTGNGAIKYKYAILQSPDNVDWNSIADTTETTKLLNVLVDGSTALSKNTKYYVYMLASDSNGNTIPATNNGLEVTTTNGVTTIADVNSVSDAKTENAQQTIVNKELNAGSKTVWIPAGFTIASDSATNADDGVVIQDSAGNQYVWIPVDTSNLYERRIYGEDTFGETDSSTGSTKITNPYSNEYYVEEMDINDFNSVSRYHGFYIGRYESGSYEDTQNCTYRSAETTAKTVTIKADQVPYNYIAFNSTKAESGMANIIDICKALGNGYTGNTYTKLCSSYAWDTTLNFIGDSNWANGTGNATICQNYSDAPEFNYYTFEDGYLVLKNTDRFWIIATGQGDSTKNIFDMGGNLYEVSSEICSAGLPTMRGACYDNSFGYGYSGIRSYYNGKGVERYGFRIALYL